MTTDSLISIAEQLPDDQLIQLAKEVASLAAKRRCPSLSSRESELFQHINQEPDPQRIQRYRELQSKRENCSLDESELQELQQLSDWLEETHAERLAAVAELAQLRGLSLPEMMRQLGIRPLST